jgi:surface carbohydrate biosynthesis protein
LIGSEELKRILFPNKSPTVLSVRGEWFCVHPIVVINFFYNAVIKKYPLRVSYDLAFISSVKPTLVVTLIDNNQNFHYLSALYNAPFFCIQNGFRSHNCALTFRAIPTLFSFGQRDIDLYLGHKVILGESFPVGSIRSSYFLETVVPTLKESPSFDICFISEYLPGMQKPDYVVTEEGVKLLYQWLFVFCDYLKEFLKDKKVNLVIAGRLRVGENDEEVAFYRKYFNESVTILPSNKEYLNSYRVAYNSSIVLSYCSSLGLEAMSWGKKTMFFPHPDEKNLALDNPKSIFLQTKTGNYEEFETKLNNLICMDEEVYKLESQEDRDYIIGTKRPAHHVIREKIELALLPKR